MAENIIINGVDVSGCAYITYQDSENPICSETGQYCKGYDICYYKQLKRKEQEYEELRKYHNKCCEENAKKLEEWLKKYNQVSREFYSGKYCNKENCSLLKAKEKECEELKKQHEGDKGLITSTGKMNYQLLQEYDKLKAENEELKKELMKKDEANTFFNTPIEGWSNDPCGIWPHKAENEELKKEIINKNEKIKELRFSVSDLTNRLCYLNAEKSFRIVDLEQTLDEIEKELKEDIYCESQECGCDDFEECLKCTKEHILDIINKAKDGNECQN